MTLSYSRVQPHLYNSWPCPRLQPHRHPAGLICLNCHALAFVCGEAFVRQLFQALCRPGGLTLFAFTLGDILTLSAVSVSAVAGWELDWNCAESSDITMHVEHWLIRRRGPESAIRIKMEAEEAACFCIRFRVGAVRHSCRHHLASRKYCIGESRSEASEPRNCSSWRW